MFSAKKIIPPGVLLPTKTRIVIILHLCILFTIVSWVFLEPFMGNLYHYRTQLSLYETVMGNPHIIEKMEDSPAKDALIEKLSFNAALFSDLKADERNLISASYEKLMERKEPSAFEKFKGAFYTLSSLSVYLQGWLLLSFATCLFLLMRIEGGAPSAWLLFLLACAFTASNQFYGIAHPLDPDAHLFPSEKAIFSEYLHEKPASSIREQYSQLQQGWERYLNAVWARGENLQEAEFRFNLARLEAWIKKPNADKQKDTSYKHSLWVLIPFCLWNLFFAYYVNRRRALI